MNIKRIKYFISTFEEGSISAAAKANDVTIQAISKAISDLESHFGDDLFERTKTGTIPTPLGRFLYPRACSCIETYEEFMNFSEEKLSFNALPKTPPFRIALCSPSFSRNDQLRANISSLLEKNTGLSIDFVLEAPSQMMHGLTSHTYDALVTIGELEHEDINCTIIGTMPTGIMVARFHPLAKEKFVSLKDLKKYPVGHSSHHDGHNKSILALYQENHLTGDVKEINSMTEAVTFMTLHNGYFFSCYMSHLGKGQAGTVVRPIEPSESIRVPICFNTLKDTRKTDHHLIENLLLLAMTLDQQKKDVI